MSQKVDECSKNHPYSRPELFIHEADIARRPVIDGLNSTYVGIIFRFGFQQRFQDWLQSAHYGFQGSATCLGSVYPRPRDATLPCHAVLKHNR